MDKYVIVDVDTYRLMSEYEFISLNDALKYATDTIRTNTFAIVGKKTYTLMNTPDNELSSLGMKEFKGRLSNGYEK